MLSQQVSSGFLPRDGLGQALLDRMDTTALDIRRTNPGVAKALAQRAAQKARELKGPEKERLRDHFAASLKVMEPELAEQMQEDGERFIAEMEAIPEDTTQEPSPTSYRFAARVIGIAVAVASSGLAIAGGAGDLYSLAMIIRSLFGL